MQTLPIEIIEQIVSYIPNITDKRQLTQTCKLCNAITYQIIQNQESKIKIKGFIYPTEKCVEKFTLELCNDAYFNMIPISYLTPKNNVIVKALTVYNQMELLKIALSNNCKLLVENRKKDEKYNDNSCLHAIISGNIEMLKFVRLHGCKWNGEIFDLAAKHNNFDIIKFLKEYGCEMGHWAGKFAAINGNIIMLEWLIANGHELDAKLCSYAAVNGHLKLIKILRNKYECPWNHQTTLWAAEYGHLDTLQWSVENGCEFKPAEAYRVANSNKNSTAIWIINNFFNQF